MSICLRRFIESFVKEGELQKVTLSFELISIGGVSSLKIFAVDNNNFEYTHLLQKISWKISAELGISTVAGAPQNLKDIKPIILTTEQINRLCKNHNLPYQASDLFKDLSKSNCKYNLDFTEMPPSLTFQGFKARYIEKSTAAEPFVNRWSDLYKAMHNETTTEETTELNMRTLKKHADEDPKSRTAEIFLEHKFGIKLSI